MLVLTRYLEEMVCIGPDVTVKVLEVRNQGGRVQVRLGFEGPPGIEIDRAEVREKKLAELDKTLDCGSLGHVSPDGLSQAIKRGIDSKPKNHQHED